MNKLLNPYVVQHDNATARVIPASEQFRSWDDDGNEIPRRDIHWYRFATGSDALAAALNMINDLGWNDYLPKQLGIRQSFSRSNGTVLARLYERLTKASRRREDFTAPQHEKIYRQGVYDAFKALQEELNA